MLILIVKKSLKVRRLYKKIGLISRESPRFFACLGLTLPWLFVYEIKGAWGDFTSRGLSRGKSDF
jgi:hypothetical protein